MIVKSTQKSCPSEHEEQREFVSWFRKTYPGTLIFAIPNGGKRGAATAARLKVEGVVAGVPDLFVPEHLLWIEMKRVFGSSVGREQKDIMAELTRVGYVCRVARGASEARAIAREILG